MAAEMGKMSLALLVVLLAVGLGLFCVDCDSGCNRDDLGESVDPRGGAEKSVSEWMDELKAVCVSRGIEGFNATRNLMIAHQSELQDDPEYDTVSMVLGLGETVITKKEAELAGRLRTLARYVEEHPGRSGLVWMRLRAKLYSYSFGNGPIDEDSVPARLAAGYEVIAKGHSDSRVGTTESISDWVDELRAIYLVDGMQGFHPTKAFMIAQQSALRTDPDYDLAAMVLRLGETAMTRKEADVAAELRALAKQIEANPNRSYEAWSSLHGKLFSYSFGNGPIDRESVPMQLAELYSLIANGPARIEGDHRGPAESTSAQSLAATRALAEATDAFTCGGKPIEPALVYELMPWTSPKRPITVAVDILPAKDHEGHSQPVVRKLSSWVECEVQHVHPGTDSRARFGYWRQGVLLDGTQVLWVYDWPEGSSQSMYLMFVRFRTDEAYDMQARPYTQLLMKAVCLYALGDDDDGEITVLSDRVIAGPSKHREKAVVIKLD